MACSEAYKKKIIALYKIRKEIEESGDRWASREYAGKGTEAGFIQKQYFWNIEKPNDRDMSDKQKAVIDQLVAQYITGNPNTVPSVEDDPIPDDPIPSDTEVLNWLNGVSAKPTDEGWVIYINDIQAGFPLTLIHAKVVGDWLHRSVEYMMLAMKYADKFKDKLPPRTTEDPADSEAVVSEDEPF